MRDKSDSDNPWRYSWVLWFPTGATVNSLYVRTRRGYRLSDPAAAWRDQVIVHIRQGFIGRRLPLNLPPGPLAFFLDAYPPDHRVRDDDNLVKLARDSVMAAFGTVDTRIRHSESTMHDPYPANPRLLVSLRPWDER